MGISAGELATASDVRDGANMPTGIINIWTGTISTIPTGWLICDGNNGTPNLLSRFLESVSSAVLNPGATGGSVSKTTNAHIQITNAQTGGADTVLVGLSSHIIADIRPPYYDVAFLYKT